MEQIQACLQDTYLHICNQQKISGISEKIKKKPFNNEKNNNIYKKIKIRLKYELKNK